MLAAVFLVPLMAPAFSYAAPPKAAVKAKAGHAAGKPTAPVQGNALLGKEKAESERCMECHGEDGQGAGHGNSAEGKFAKLAGQHPVYLLKQLNDFKTGARKNDQMVIMARSLSEEDARDIATYFHGLPAMKPDGTAKGEALARGKALFEQGDAAKGIAACASCHGPQGEGVAGLLHVPIVKGQEWRYLDKQLRDWRSGDRKNSPDPAMSQVTQGLTDKDIEALATYLSGM